jgi:hypothetical protein
MGDRARGVLLYASAVVLLAAGVVWWFRAAPRASADPTIERWRENAQRLLPDVEDQQDADTVALSASRNHDVLADVGSGQYWVSVVCVGGSASQVRVSLGEVGTDSGRGLSCAGEGPSDRFKVSTSGQLRLHVTVNDSGPVVFRYALSPVVG